MVTLYCGVNEQRWNYHPVAPGAYACVAPSYGKTERTRTENRVSLPTDCLVIQDSGAFSDSVKSRLTFDQALRRQIEHAEKYGYADQIQYRASYDLLIDEIWDEGNRHKRRWSESAAASAVDETVAAAHYLNQHRENLRLIQSAQGVTAKQYLDCTKRILPTMQSGDVFGLGGWCIIGKLPKAMMPTFRETILAVIPFIASEGIRCVRIWGVIYPKALGELAYMCHHHNLELSTDSAGPNLKPCFGEWGYAEWRDNSYQRPSVETRGLERARHVQTTRAWLECFHTTKHFREPKTAPRQLVLF